MVVGVGIPPLHLYSFTLLYISDIAAAGIISILSAAGPIAAGLYLWDYSYGCCWTYCCWIISLGLYFFIAYNKDDFVIIKIIKKTIAFFLINDI